MKTGKVSWRESFAVGDGTDEGLGAALAKAKDYAEQMHPGSRESMMTPSVRRSGILKNGGRSWIVSVVGRL